MNNLLKSSIETWFKKTLEKKDSKKILFLLIFWPFSFLFKLGSLCFHYLYDKKFLTQESVNIPICSIGNIVLGGVGKTPIVLLLGQALEEKVPLAIISRGYHSSLEKANAPFLLSKDNGPVMSAHHAGDEPYFLATKLPKAKVIVGKNRVKAAELCQKCDTKLILLDDAMQHRRLKRDFEIVVLDSQNLFGYFRHFPCGLLRESPKGLRRANLIICNHTEENQNLDELKEKIKPFTKAPIVFTRYKMDPLQDIQTLNPIVLDKEPIAVFAAIGNPFRFKSMLEKEEFKIVNTFFLHDHAFVSRKLLDSFALKSKELGAKAIVVTEKDAVKINKNWKIALPIAVAPISTEIIQGKEIWDLTINHLLSLSLKKEMDPLKDNCFFTR
ncbi:tetraacyldisaccharide 4'-kinase [Criblamydia sequanensis]|uniref:Tetraacyldisaccharide 4'-kinase n=1 Tax=Candidatus Criblamydia sequanensis CRIB-18 TaxID=1437425 RepID=A0A090D276_9BACT|nr:tetraacyldisaccharide 4'-kinase [Criblamydia sequanensis]CDR34395.1 Tetraacyldisaccharide 4'-kinase [Criblamydia sequanensis CRIB-18]